MNNTHGISSGIRFGDRPQLVVSRFDEDHGTIAYLCRLRPDGATLWTTDPEDDRIWMFSDQLDAEMMLGFAAGYDDTAAVVEYDRG